MESYNTRSRERDQNRFGSFSSYLITLLIAFLLSMLAGVVSVTGSPGISNVLVVVAVIFAIISSVLMLIILYRVWEFVIELSHKNNLKPAVTSPAQAVGFLFIPLFNFYWIFKAYATLPMHLNTLLKLKNSTMRIPPGLGLLISVTLLFSIFPVTGLALSIINLGIIVPVFFHKSIQACKLLYNLRNEESISPSFIEPDFESIWKSKDLFEFFGLRKGFNLHLVTFTIIAVFLSNTLTILFLNFGDFDIDFIFRYLSTAPIAQVIISVSTVIVFLLLCRIRPNRFILIGLYGLAGGILIIFFYLITSGIAKITHSMNYVHGGYLYNALAGFLAAISMLTLLMFAVQFFGLKWWALVAAFFINSIVTAIFYSSLWALLGHGDFELAIFKNIHMSIFSSLIFASAWYFGIRQHFLSEYNLQKSMGIQFRD